MARLYIIGPVTGIEDGNLPAFRDAARELRAAGHGPLLPHGFVDPGTEWGEAMRISINALTLYSKDGRLFDGVAMLPGWEKSKGACLEKQVAEACGIPCKAVDEWLESSCFYETRECRGYWASDGDDEPHPCCQACCFPARDLREDA